jgi:gliding motility-associated-like protein
VDGLNDYFAFPEDALQGISLFEVSIFDRWGEMVFYSRDKSFRWNGEVGGRIPVGTVFTYLIRYTDTSGRPFELRGTLTVL